MQAVAIFVFGVCGRESLVLFVVIVQRQGDMFQVMGAMHSFCRLARALHCGQQKAYENSGAYDKQYEEDGNRRHLGTASLGRNIGVLSVLGELVISHGTCFL